MLMLYLRCTTRADTTGAAIPNLDPLLAANIWAAATLMWHGLLRTSEIHSKTRKFHPLLNCSRADLSSTPETGRADYMDLDVNAAGAPPHRRANRQG